MSVLKRYADFRNWFTQGGTDTDGMPSYDPPEDGQIFKPFTSWQFSTPVNIDLSSFGGWGTDGHWYIAQPTEGSGYERWQITQTSAAVASLRMTAYGFSEQTALLAAGFELEQIRQRQLRGVHIYARDVDEAFTYVADLWRCAFAPDSFS